MFSSVASMRQHLNEVQCTRCCLFTYRYYTVTNRVISKNEPNQRIINRCGLYRRVLRSKLCDCCFGSDLYPARCVSAILTLYLVSSFFIISSSFFSSNIPGRHTGFGSTVVAADSGRTFHMPSDPHPHVW